MATSNAPEVAEPINYDLELEQILEYSYVQPNLLKKGAIIHQGVGCNVYAGEYDSRKVAIKELIEHKTSNVEEDSLVNAAAEMKERFKVEVVLLNRARHPNIVEFIAASRNPVMIITEFITGGTLQNYLDANAVDKRQSIEFALHISRALHFLHTKCIIHRDLNPTNILLTEDRDIKLVDFGDAKFTGDSEGVRFRGALRWAAPEMNANMSLVDPKADVYSFSLVLLALLTHAIPFKNIQGEYTVLVAASENKRPSYDKVDKSYVPLLISCWAKDPKKRPKFIKIAALLTKFLDGLPSSEEAGDNCCFSSCSGF